MTQATSPIEARVMLLTRQGCHLCVPARETVAELCGEQDWPWVELDVDADAELLAEYGDQVPVVLVDGVEVAALRVDEAALRTAMSGRV